MNIQSIGESAGIIWRLLYGEHRKWSYQEIKEATGLPDRYINAAIGWLAREGKLSIEDDAEEEEEGQHKGKNTLYIELNYYIG